MQARGTYSRFPLTSQVRLAESQAKREREVARCVIVVDLDGNVTETIWNDPYYLRVVAIVGPYLDKSIGVFYPETVLLEVAFNRFYPYRDAWVTNGKRRHVTSRSRFGTLSKEQFANVWPKLENAMYSIAERQVNVWEYKNWSVRKSNACIRTKTADLMDGEQLRGCCFSVSLSRDNLSIADRLVIATVVQGELKKRQISMEKDMQLLVREVARICRDVSDCHFTTTWLREALRKCRSNHSVDWALTVLQRRHITPYMQFLILHFAEKKGQWVKELFECLFVYMDLTDYRSMHEWRRMCSWKGVPQWETDVYLWTGRNAKEWKINRRKTQRDKHFLFDVIPIIDPVTEKDRRSTEVSDEDDDIPF